MIAALVLAHNSEHTIARTLKSLDWVDEVVIVADQCTDSTLTIVKQFPKTRIFERALDDFASQKNFGLKQINAEWILSIDSDEEVTPALRDEILAEMKTPRAVVYYIPIKNIFFGQWMKHGGLYPCYCLRFFSRANATFTGKVHEKLHTTGEPKYLQNHFLHYGTRSISHYFEKTNKYSTLMSMSVGECTSWPVKTVPVAGGDVPRGVGVRWACR